MKMPYRFLNNGGCCEFWYIFFTGAVVRWWWCYTIALTIAIAAVFWDYNSRPHAEYSAAFVFQSTNCNCWTIVVLLMTKINNPPETLNENFGLLVCCCVVVDMHCNCIEGSFHAPRNANNRGFSADSIPVTLTLKIEQTHSNTEQKESEKKEQQQKRKRERDGWLRVGAHCKKLVHCCCAAGKQFLKQTKYVNNANKWHRNNPKRTCCKMQTNWTRNEKKMKRTIFELERG